MKLCGATTLLYSNKLNEYNKALWCHNIVGWEENKMRTMKLCGATALLYGKKQNEHNEALCCHNIVGWEIFKTWIFTKSKYLIWICIIATPKSSKILDFLFV